jgi:hypothetical protein
LPRLGTGLLQVDENELALEKNIFSFLFLQPPNLVHVTNAGLALSITIDID